MSIDLWPEFHPEKTHSVAQILRDAGEGIGEKTGGVVRFDIQTTAAGSEFTHDCYLWVSKLSFKYPLVKVIHGIDPFPARVIADPFPNGIDVSDKNELLKKLEIVFHSDQVRKIVEQLLVIA